jgi:hypothetical protein
VKEQISGRRVRHGEVHGERAEASVAGQSKGRMFVEDLPVQVNADVGLHVLRAIIQHLKLEG